jgi:hypothetical protein
MSSDSSSSSSSDSDDEHSRPDEYVYHSNVNGVTNDLEIDNLELIDEGWLKIPEQFIAPKTMCAVNQFVHVVSELSDLYMSNTCELVLFGTGTSIPEHFRWMIYLTEMVSKFECV